MIAGAALVLGLALQGAANLEDLADDAPPSALAANPTVRRWVAGHRASLPEVTAALASPSWKTRLGAAFALREMGFSKPLYGIVEDANPRVRDFVRAVVERPPHDPDLKRPPPYSRDPAQRELTEALLSVRPALDEAERKTRTRAAFEELLRPDLSQREQAIALSLVSRDRPVALEALAQRAPALALDQVLNALAALSLDGALERLPSALAATIDKGAADSNPRIRSLALRASGALPEEERAARVTRALGDADSGIRRAALLDLAVMAREAHDRGDGAKADLYLKRADASVEAEKDPETRDVAREEVEKALDRVLYERRLLLHGEATEPGSTSRQRYLKVGKSLIAVSDREYELCNARGRGPYLHEAAFTELRKGVAAELSAATPPALPPPGAVRTSDGTGSSAAASAKKEASGEQPASERSYGGLIAVAVLVVAVGLIFFLRPKSSPT